MRIASTLNRGILAALGLVLCLAGAAPLTAQTAENPVFVVNSNLQFAHQTGAVAQPPPQTIRVYALPFNTPFTATVTTQSGAGWLSVNNLLVYTGRTDTTGQNDLVVRVSPNLPPGTYSGTIAITGGNATLPINVTLTVSTNPVVRAEPSSLVHEALEAGRARSIDIAVSSSGVQTAYSTSVVSATPATGWLTVLQDSGLTGGKTTLVINGAQLGDAGLALATVRFNTAAGPVTLPISIAVQPGAQLQVSPTTVTFPHQIGFAAPSPRMVNVTSSTQTQLTYLASITTSSPWLTLSTVSQTTPGTLSVNGSTPGQLWLIPNIAAVQQAAGTHEATIRIESTTGSVQNITARLVLSTTPQLTVSQDAAAFSYTLGGTTPAAQTINVGSTSFPQTIIVTPTYTSGGTWFTATATSPTTPSTVSIAIDPARLAQLTAGTYTGSVRIASTTSEVTVPVSLTVSGTALLTVEPVTIEPFTWQPGQPTPPGRTLIVRSTDGSNQSFTAAVEYGTGATGWLVLSPTTGATGPTGTVLQMNVNTTAVAVAGTYEATIVITPTGVTSAPAVRIPVRYTLTGSAQVTASVTRIEKTQVGTTVPASETISLTSTTPGLNFVATATPSWIRLNPTNGSIPGSIQVSFDTASLAPGDYSGSITIVVGGAQTLSIPVALRVQSAATLQVAPAGALTFSATQGAPAPAAQTLNLTSTGVPINFTATPTSTVGNANWLSVEPRSGTTPASLRVSVNPSGLAPGTYSGVVRIDSTNASNPATTINVNLTISAQATPAIRSVVNAASGLARGVSPGMIATIFGTNMAPSTQNTASVTNGMIGTSLADVQVLFDNIPAPVLYAGPGGGQDQINVIVPYGVGGRQSTSVVVSYRGVRSTPITFQVNEALPGIFTIPSGGTGHGAILNQNFSVNSQGNPARRGEVIQIYATGEGAVTPSVADGRVIPPVVGELRRPLLPVQVRIGDQVLTPAYAGSAPGLVSGAFQVNVMIPANFPVAAAQNLPISIVVGNVVSQPGVTVAVAP